jgi:hypothetical protein
MLTSVVIYNRKMVEGIFCDLQEASECVNHIIVLAKFESYRITGTSLTLTKYYLEGTYQRVILNNSYFIIVWGNSCYSNIIFQIQKINIRIMVGIWDLD